MQYQCMHVFFTCMMNGGQGMQGVSSKAALFRVLQDQADSVQKLHRAAGANGSCSEGVPCVQITQAAVRVLSC